MVNEYLFIYPMESRTGDSTKTHSRGQCGTFKAGGFLTEAVLVSAGPDYRHRD